MPGLGDEFRAAREARHLSLSDVSEQVHIRSVYLQSIEDEAWSSIGAPVYVRGFIRTYARFLGIDAQRAVEHFNASLGESPAKPHEPFAASSTPRAPRPSPWIWVAAFVAAALVGFVGYNVVEVQNGRTSPPGAVGIASPGSQSATSDTAAPALVPAKRSVSQAKPSVSPMKRTLEVRLTERTWLSVRIDGAQAAEGTFPAGTRKAFHGTTADVRAGNAGGVELTVNGKELGSMGPSGDVVERTFQLADE